MPTIYVEGVEGGNATFETEAPSWVFWHEHHRPDCRLIAEVYAGVTEVSIYVAARFQRRGVARVLMTRLVSASEDAGIWTLQAGIFPENTASLALHEGAGFRVVGRRERIGRRDGMWRDVVLLERRSTRAGVDGPT